MGGFVRDISGQTGARRAAEAGAAQQMLVSESAGRRAKDRLLSQFGVGMDAFSSGSRDAQQTLGSLLTGTLGDISASSSEAQSQLQPFADIGGQAAQREAALSGALGQQAQAEAMQSFTESPGQAFLREQGEKAALRGASSQGRSLGGGVLAELQRRGIGLAQQDFGNQMARLSSIAGRGQNASSDIANIIRGAGAQTVAARTGFGQNIANLQLGRGETEFQARQSLGSSLANAAMGIGSQQSQIIGNRTSNIGGAHLAGGQFISSLLGGAAGAAGGEA